MTFRMLNILVALLFFSSSLTAYAQAEPRPIRMAQTQDSSPMSLPGLMGTIQSLGAALQGSATDQSRRATSQPPGQLSWANAGSPSALTSANAQSTPPNPGTSPFANPSTHSMAAPIGATQAAIPTNPGTPMTHDELVQFVLELQTAVQQLSQMYKDNDVKIDQLRIDWNVAKDQLKTQIDQQAGILNALSTQDPATSEYIPRIDAWMQNAQFSRGLQQAVEKSYPQSGTVVIRNAMLIDEEVSVNGQQRTIIAGASSTFTVPLEHVSIRLPDQEPTFWSLTPPKFELALKMTPQRQPSRSQSTSTYESPSRRYSERGWQSAR